jgi:hypothetical protein
MSDVLGYAASSAVLVSCLMRSMIPLRLVAILSNILFLSYGYAADIHPVFLLHAALLPINVARLATCGDGNVLDRLRRNLYFVSATARVRHLSLFILGLTAGSLGIRAFIHAAFVFFNQCRRTFV